MVWGRFFSAMATIVGWGHPECNPLGTNLGRGAADTGSVATMNAARWHREVSGRFGEVVAGTTDWDAPTPVPEWQARDVVGHLVSWFPPFLAAGTGIELPPGPSVAEDPVAAWRHHRGHVQALLDEPSTKRAVYASAMLGEIPLATAVARFYVADIFMHTWDLARATGQDDLLDQTTCADLLSGMAPMEEMIRASGQFGTRVAVPAGASAQDRLLGFIGRDPSWRPPT